ncbi:hypothetical protein PHMEG_00021747 [Phytophthora megakarya]|uniref:Polycystin cation channel PKD1/PKD2 domain-containing protein n=1 Tax=Phytophthora megakarya TaxID=4795 RepID=A0A225VL37_9STRA|nr:hypothetical protein PHMEG_00021747 [Phytophthora megakarya]
MKKILLALLSFCIFVSAMFEHVPSTSMYNEQYGIISELAPSNVDNITTNSPIKFYNIETIPDIFEWLNYTFIPEVFGTTDYNGDILPKSQWGQVATFNYLLGAVRFAVTNRQQMECNTPTHLGNLYAHCYDSSNTMTDDFFVNFDMNATNAIAEVTQRKETGTWVNSSTKQMVITVVTFNGELQRYAVTDLQFDFTDGGFAKPSISSTSTSSDLYPSQSSIADDVVAMLWFTIHPFLVIVIPSLRRLWMTVHNSSESRTKREKVTVSWDTFIVFTSYLCVNLFYITLFVTQSMITNSEFQTKLSGLRDEGQVDHDNLVSVTRSFRNIAYLAIAQRVCGSLAILLLSNNILNAQDCHARMSIIKRTLAKAVRSAFAFIIAFMVNFIAFAAAGTMLFGHSVAEFSSLQKALETCASMAFGDFDFAIIKAIDYSLIYYCLYMAVQTLVVLNIALALVMDAFSATTSKNSDKMAYGRVIRIFYREYIENLFNKFCSKATKKTYRETLRPSELLEKLTKPSHHQYVTPSHLQSLFPQIPSDILENTFTDLKTECRRLPEREGDAAIAIFIERQFEDRLKPLLDKKFALLAERLQQNT